MNAPDSQIPDEMLSAYLDGELSPSDVQKVTAALEHSEDLRALMADLKLIRSEIQSLPMHALSTDFATRIAESCSIPTTTSSLPETAVTQDSQRRSRFRVITVVSALAAADAIGV